MTRRGIYKIVEGPIAHVGHDRTWYQGYSAGRDVYKLKVCLRPDSILKPFTYPVDHHHLFTLQ